MKHARATNNGAAAADDPDQPATKRARFVDPVTLAPPNDPFVLAACFHTIDAATLKALQKDGTASIACPTCRTVNYYWGRNYALAEEMGIDALPDAPEAPTPAMNDYMHTIAREKEEKRRHVQECDDTFVRLVAQHIGAHLNEWTVEGPVRFRPPLVIYPARHDCFNTPSKFSQWEDSDPVNRLGSALSLSSRRLLHKTQSILASRAHLDMWDLVQFHVQLIYPLK